MNILVVDDEPQIRRALRTSLQAHGHHIETVGTGTEAIEVVASGPMEVVFLDLGLPDMDGVEVVRRLRAFSSVPIIVISVRESQQDKVGALDAGADDYVTKPFGVDELLARLRAVIRRKAPETATASVLKFGEITCDLAKRLVTIGGTPVHFTPTEYDLLEALVTNPGKLLTHTWLLQRVWGGSYGDESHYLRVYVRQLRQKLGDDATAPRFIVTEPGVGYRWIAEADREGEAD